MGAVVPTHDTANSAYMRALRPTETYCFRCGYPQSMIVAHKVAYYFGVSEDTVTERGLYILCESCHRLLGTWEARWPYYLRLLEKWKETGDPLDPDEQIDLYLAIKSGS